MYSTATITTNVWHHAAATYDGTTWNLYLDGANVGTLAVGQPVRSDSIGHAALATSLNSTGGTNGFFAGVIDEARIWNVARTGPQILASRDLEIPSATNLIGRWGLNEGTGTTAGDSAAPAENGTLTNGPLWVDGAPFEVNAPPDAPVVVSPADGATGVSTAPTLDVTVSDTDSSTLSATFYGRAAGGAASDFTIVTIPDTQYYSESYPATFTAQTTWIRDSAGTLNTVFATHLGDITDGATQTEFDRASASMQVLDTAGVPNSLIPGNHDQANYTRYDATFPVSRYSANAWWGGSQSGVNRNSYQLFSVGGLDFIIVNLENSPDPTARTWASGILAANSSRRAIVVTHDYLVSGGTRSTAGTNIWNDVVSSNCNVFLVLAGHALGEAVLSTARAGCGDTVPQILQDYQGRSNGGDGWLRYYTFKPSENKIYAYTYKVPQGVNPGEFEVDAGSQFTIDYAMGGSSAFAIIGTDTGVASGGHATVDWPGRATGTGYEWYVDVSDGSATTSGPTWLFTTFAPENHPPVCSPVTLTTNEDVTGSTAPSCADEDGNTLSYSIVSQPANGAASVVSGQLRDAPAANYNGPDAFTYRAFDGLAYSDPANVTVTVNAVNDAPSFTKGAEPAGGRELRAAHRLELGDRHQQGAGGRVRSDGQLHRHQRQQRPLLRPAGDQPDGHPDLHAGDRRHRHGHRDGEHPGQRRRCQRRGGHQRPPDVWHRRRHAARDQLRHPVRRHERLRHLRCLLGPGGDELHGRAVVQAHRHRRRHGHQRRHRGLEQRRPAHRQGGSPGRRRVHREHQLVPRHRHRHQPPGRRLRDGHRRGQPRAHRRHRGQQQRVAPRRAHPRRDEPADLPRRGPRRHSGHHRPALRRGHRPCRSGHRPRQHRHAGRDRHPGLLRRGPRRGPRLERGP